MDKSYFCFFWVSRTFDTLSGTNLPGTAIVMARQGVLHRTSDRFLGPFCLVRHITTRKDPNFTPIIFFHTKKMTNAVSSGFTP
jgi:hypothetical protein